MGLLDCMIHFSCITATFNKRHEMLVVGANRRLSVVFGPTHTGLPWEMGSNRKGNDETIE